MGDKKPDFYHTCEALTIPYMETFNKANPDARGVYYQSFAAVMSTAMSDILLSPMFLLTSRLEGRENDGLVSVENARWTNFRGVLRGATGRGISHADEVDIRRMNFSNAQGGGISDMRVFYTAVVAELKMMGY